MKRTTLMITILATAFYFSNLTALAQHGHGGGAAGGQGAHGIGSMNKPDSNKGMKSEEGKDISGMPHDKTVSDRLAHNPVLSSKLQGLLPPNTKLQDASSGFKNMGQFVAAVHVSHNLNLPFDQLKAKMTGNPSMSLGKAIHALSPNVDAKAEAKKAEKQRDKDIRDAKAETKEAEQHGDKDKETSGS